MGNEVKTNDADWMTAEEKRFAAMQAEMKALRVNIAENKTKGRDYAELTLQRELFALWMSGAFQLKSADLGVLEKNTLAKLKGKSAAYAKLDVKEICTARVKVVAQGPQKVSPVFASNITVSDTAAQI